MRYAVAAHVRSSGRSVQSGTVSDGRRDDNAQVRLSEMKRLHARIAELESLISAQQEASRSLVASEARYRRLFEAAQDGILILNADTGEIDAVNPFLIELLGYSERDLLGKKLWESGPFKDERLSQNAFRELQGQRHVRYDEVPLESSDGRSIAVEIVCNVYSSGGTQVIQCNIRDITGRRRAEENEERLVAILEATPDLVSMADMTGRLIYLNRGGRDMVGMPNGVDLGSYNIRDFHDTASRDKISAAAIPTAVREGHWRGEADLLALDGRRIPVSEVILTQKAKDGTIEFTSTIARDISEQRQADRNQRLQSAALRAASDGIAITDLAGVIEWVNPGFTQLTGYTADEAVGLDHRALVKSDAHDAAFFEELWDTIRAGHTWHGQVVNRCKDGRLRTVSETVTPIADASGHATHFVGIQRDITEQLLLEAQFRQAHKMESVGQLTSGIAHDFNNLLTVIVGMANLVLTELDEHHPAREDVREILLAGESATALTRQLLSFSRQQLLSPKMLDLNAMIGNLDRLLRRLLSEDIHMTLALTLDRTDVRADVGQIEQVITNLVVNARDAMPGGGHLAVATQCVFFDEPLSDEFAEVVPCGSYVRLSVSDSGSGMDEATRLRAFDPFFTTKDAGKGTGLGLSTVYGIVKQHQGFVRLYSEVGMGTTVSIYLPEITNAAAEIAPPAPAVASTTGTETILLVEDNGGLRKLATRILEPAGYIVIEAASGVEAVMALEGRDAPVHLLLTDVVLPGMNGRHLAERLAETRPEMKVIYMSGHTNDAVVRHGVIDATVAFLGKPFTAAALLQRVREVLDT
jgi:PAS domain S-box-containing protein